MEVDEANFNAIMRVNAWGVLLCTQEAARQMIAQGAWRQDRQHRLDRRTAGLCRIRALLREQGLRHFADPGAAREFAKHKITVNAFAPGVVVTPLWDGLEQDMIDKGVIKQKGEFIESFSSSILLGFPSKPKDIVGVAAFLASSDSDYVTGQVIMADGGMVLV